MQVGQLVNKYIAERERRGEWGESTVKQRRVMLRAWIDFAGEPPWTEEQVAEYVHDPTLRPNARKSRLGAVRPFVRWLVLEGVLESDPTLRIGKVVVPAGAPRDLAPEEIGQLLAACPDDRAYLVVTLMAQLGLRVGDVARIRIEDIDQHRRLLHVRAKGGRGEPTHWEPIPREAWSVLSAWLDQSPYSGWLIRSQGFGRQHDPVSPHHLSKLFRGWMRAAGLKDRPWDGRSSHSLRHSCAQHMLDAGADLREVQYTLGHKTIRSTELCLRRDPPGLRDAMEGRRYSGAGVRVA